MDRKELIRSLEDIEWEDFEVKEARDKVPKSAWETVSAFSNTSGGWLVFGVKKNGLRYKITGVSRPEKIEQDFTTTLRGTKFNKNIEVKSRKYSFPEGIVLAFYIPQRSSIDKPIYFNTQKNTFIRTASGDQRATAEEIDSFFRASSFESKDREKTDRKMEDVNIGSIKRYRTYFANINPGHRYNTLSDHEFLEKMGLLKDGKITFGGILVFGSEDSIINEISSYKIEYLEIPGTSYEDGPTRYSHRITSEEGLFTTFFELYDRLIKKVDIPFNVSKGIRDDDPPHVQAVREALVNLLIHTDYFSSSNPRIRVFSDRLEFFNPGALPKKLEFILKEDFSLPRNPTIAKIFRYIRLAESIGSGFHKMIEGWKENYHVEPIIDSDFDHFKITFPLPEKVTTDKTTEKTTDNTTEKEILDLITSDPYISQLELADRIGITVDGIRYHMDKLKQRGIIKRVGGKKFGYWEVLI